MIIVIGTFSYVFRVDIDVNFVYFVIDEYFDGVVLTDCGNYVVMNRHEASKLESCVVVLCCSSR